MSRVYFLCLRLQNCLLWEVSLYMTIKCIISVCLHQDLILVYIYECKHFRVFLSNGEFVLCRMERQVMLCNVCLGVGISMRWGGDHDVRIHVPEQKLDVLVSLCIRDVRMWLYIPPGQKSF